MYGTVKTGLIRLMTWCRNQNLRMRLRLSNQAIDTPQVVGT